MKEKMLEQFSFPEEFKEKLVLLVMYHNQSVKEVTKSYNLPNVYILTNWIALYKKKLEKGAINLAAMDLKGEKDPATLKQRIQQLEKALEKANVLIYGLNAMIDYAPEGAQSPRAKKAWYQTVLLIKEKRITKMGVRPLCRLLQQIPTSIL